MNAKRAKTERARLTALGVGLVMAQPHKTRWQRLLMWLRQRRQKQVKLSRKTRRALAIHLRRYERRH